MLDGIIVIASNIALFINIVTANYDYNSLGVKIIKNQLRLHRITKNNRR
jgi:hypothetical protein